MAGQEGRGRSVPRGRIGQGPRCLLRSPPLQETGDSEGRGRRGGGPGALGRRRRGKGSCGLAAAYGRGAFLAGTGTLLLEAHPAHSTRRSSAAQQTVVLWHGRR